MNFLNCNLSRKLYPIIKNDVIFMITKWLNEESDKVIKGKEGIGIDFRTLKYIRSHLI